MPIGNIQNSSVIIPTAPTTSNTVNENIDNCKLGILKQFKSTGDENYDHYFKKIIELINYITLSEINVINAITEIYATMVIESNKILDKLVLKYAELSDYNFV